MSSVADFLRRPVAAALICGAWVAFFVSFHAAALPWAIWLVVPVVVVGVSLLERQPVVAALLVLVASGGATLLGMPFGEIDLLLPVVSIVASLGLNLDSIVPGLLFTLAFAVAFALREDAPWYGAALSALTHGPAWLFGVIVRRRAGQALEAARESASLAAVDLEAMVTRSARAGRERTMITALSVLRAGVHRMRELAEEMARGDAPYRSEDADAIRREGDRAIGRLHDTLTLLDARADAPPRGGGASQDPGMAEDASLRANPLRRIARWVGASGETAVPALPRWFTGSLLAASVLTGIVVQPHPFLTVAAVIIAACTVVVHRMPVIAALAAGAGFLLAAAEPGHPPDALLPLGIGLGGLVWQLTRMPTARGGLLLLSVIVPAVLLGTRFGRQGAGFVLVLIIVTFVAATAWKENNRVLQREQARSVRLMAGIAVATVRADRAERMLLARELHDGVSHGITAMSLQVGAAYALGAVDPPRARRSLAAALHVGACTLDEIDAIASGRTGEQSAVMSLEVLIDGARASGLDIRHRTTGGSDPLSYRIVQEALTNITRYAPGSRVVIDSGEQDGRRFVRVVDSGAPDAAGDGLTATRGVLRSLGQGRGLAGLAERVAEQGGRFSAGPSGRGFEIDAEWRVPHDAGRVAGVPVRQQGGDGNER